MMNQRTSIFKRQSQGFANFQKKSNDAFTTNHFYFVNISLLKNKMVILVFTLYSTPCKENFKHHGK